MGDFKDVKHGKVVFFKWKNAEGWPVEFVSENIQEVLGYTTEDFYSAKISYADIIHPKDIERVFEEVQNASIASSEFTHEPYRLKSSLDKYHIIYDHTVILRNDQGEITHYLGYIFDMTDVETDRSRLKLVLEGTQLGLWDWNPKTNEVTFDTQWARMLGHELNEISPSLESWESRVHPDDLAACRSDIMAHMEGRTEIYQNIHRMKHKDGHWVYVWDRGKIVERDEDGTPTRFTGTHTDITKEKEAELKLIEEHNSKERFFALMSHEIRTPMNGVLGFTELLLQDERLNEELKETVRLIESSSKGLLSIINDILDYSKFNQLSFKFVERDFNLINSLIEMIETFQIQAVQSKNDISFNYSKDTNWDIYADEVRILQIFKNLISNAIKYSSHSKIIINVELSKNLLKASVQDFGEGISEEAQEYLFAPFIQESSDLNTKLQGTGLGLSICKKLCQAMKGDITVESEKGKGSLFKFEINVEPSQKNKRIKPQDPINDNQAFDYSNVRTLIAEDNETNQVLFRSICKKIGLPYKIVNNGSEALEQAINEEFDLIFMDLQMPIMGGIEATTEILKRGAKNPNLKIISVTANAFHSDKKKCLEAGMVDFLPKPININDFKLMIKRHYQK